MVLLFVGSSTCTASGDPALPGAIEELKLRLSEYGERNGLTFRATAVSVDWLPEDGLDFLGPFGTFDEISVGGNWTGHALVRQTWDHQQPPATPSVYLIHRHLRVDGDSLEVRAISLANERVLLRRRGVTELVELASLAPEQYLDDRIGVTSNRGDPCVGTRRSGRLAIRRLLRHNERMAGNRGEES